MQSDSEISLELQRIRKLGSDFEVTSGNDI